MKHILINNKKYPTPFQRSHFNGVVLSMSDKEFEKMRVRGSGYLASGEFEPDSVAYVHYDEAQEVCELDEESCSGKVGRILVATQRYLPSSTRLFAFRPKERKYKVELMAAEFRVAGGGLARDVASDDLDTDSGVDDPGVGVVGIRLSAKALKYLERLPTSAISVAGESQREIAGELVLTEVRGGVGTLSLVSGGKVGRTKGVKLNKLAPYTYHSHPEDAYTSSGVGMGFPSVNDYTIFFVNRTMKVHFVASLEGLYVLSRAESEVDDVSASEFKKILEDSFIASKTNGMSGSSHANAMTELGFFRVSFWQWRDVGTSDILNI